jgi:hypothetical protein
MSEYRGPVQPTFPNVTSDPANPIVGQTWYNTTEGVAKIYTALGKIQILKTGGGPYGIFPPVAGDPSNPAVGQCWFNTVTGKARIHLSSGNVDFTTGTGGGGIQFDAQTGAAGNNVSSISANLTHGANADIVIAVGMADPTLTGKTITVTVGGASATQQGSPYAGSPWLFTINRASAATESVVATVSAAVQALAFIAASFVGSTTHTYEALAYPSPATTSPATDSIALGTAGRMIIHVGKPYNALSTDPTFTLDSQLTLVATAVAGAGTYRERVTMGRLLSGSALNTSEAWSPTGTAACYLADIALKP